MNELNCQDKLFRRTFYIERKDQYVLADFFNIQCGKIGRLQIVTIVYIGTLNLQSLKYQSSILDSSGAFDKGIRGHKCLTRQ